MWLARLGSKWDRGKHDHMIDANFRFAPTTFIAQAYGELRERYLKQGP